MEKSSVDHAEPLTEVVRQDGRDRRFIPAARHSEAGHKDRAVLRFAASAAAVFVEAIGAVPTQIQAVRCR